MNNLGIVSIWLGRGGQAVRQESAKLLYVGAIPTHASDRHASVMKLANIQHLKCCG